MHQFLQGASTSFKAFQKFPLKKERLGLGAPIPKDFLEGDANKPNQLTSNDLLRRRLLGKKSSKITARNSEDINKAPLTRTPKAPIEVESEEDQGRSSLGAMKGKKRTRKAITSKGTAVGILSGERTESADERNAEADADEAVKGSNSFLDQVLRENERKRRRKEKKARKREIEKQIKARENG